MLDVSFFLLGLNVNSIPIASGDFTATSVIDSVNGAYTFNGAPVALADIIDCTTLRFNPATDIDAGGIKPDPAQTLVLLFKGDLLAAALTGHTSVWEIYTGDGFSVSSQLYDDPAFNFFSIAQVFSDTGGPEVIAPTYVQQIVAINGSRNDDDLGTPPANLTIKIAATFALDRIAMSINGAAATVISSAGLDPAMNTVEYDWSGGIYDHTARFRKFSVYPVQADIDLPALSAP